MPDDDGKVLVGVRIEPEKRDEWKEFVDNSTEYSSMAGMMRAGVSRIMSDEDDENTELMDELDTVSARMGEVLRQVRNLKQDVNTIEEDLPDVDEIADETSFRVDELPEGTTVAEALELLTREQEDDT